MPRRIIDDRGEQWNPADSGFAERLGTTLRGRPLADYCVRNLGFAEIESTEKIISLWCRPSLLSPITFAALLGIMARVSFEKAVVHLLDRQWHHYILPGFQEAVAILSTVVRCDGGPEWKGDWLLRKDVEPNLSILKPTANRAEAVFAQSYRDYEMRAAFDALFRGRWSMYTVDSETGHSILIDIGRSYTPLNPAWLNNGRGRSLCEYGDYNYGMWVTDHYRRTLLRATSAFDLVDAIVEFPSIGRARLRYSRATIPGQMPDGRRVVLSGAISDTSINLRH